MGVSINTIMILTKEVIAKVHSKFIKHFENLGYVIPRVPNVNGKLVVKHGTEIKVKVEHLPKESQVLVKTKCDICGIEREQTWQRASHYCLKCGPKFYHGGEKHSNWKGGFSVQKKKCVDCGKEIIGQHNRCKECFLKYVTIPQQHCKECGIKISKGTKHNRCSKCQNTGKNNPRYDDNLTNEERLIKRNISGLSGWRKNVLERDKCKCRKCGKKGKLNNGTLASHHINNFKEYKKLRTNIDNGITFCINCHKDIHNKFGQKTNVQMLLEFLK